MFFRPRTRDKHSQPLGVLLDPDAAELLRLQSLLAIVLRAVALQAEAEAVLSGCAQPGDTPSSIARRGQLVAADYGRLHGWAMDLCGHDTADSLPRRITQLLHYHAEIIDVALKLAFPCYRSPKLERRRLALTGLGAPAQVLRDAEVTLRLWITELPDEG